jgi:hypothetical protein
VCDAQDHPLLATALLALAMLGAAPAALADPASDSAKLREAVTLQNIRKHQAALQAIADANGGTRASGTAGYDQSVDYVVKKLREAKYQPTVVPFNFDFFRELAPATLDQTAPTPTSYQTGTFTYSGSGNVTAGVTPSTCRCHPRPSRARPAAARPTTSPGSLPATSR